MNASMSIWKALYSVWVLCIMLCYDCWIGSHVFVQDVDRLQNSTFLICYFQLTLLVMFDFHWFG